MSNIKSKNSDITSSSDGRAYFMCKVDAIHWAFTPIQCPYMSSFLPIQIWECEKESYTFYRVCHTYIQAHNMNIRAMLGMTDVNEGPDIYCVTNKNDKSIAAVWKPSTIGKIEIIVALTPDDKAISYELSDTMTQEEIALKLRVIINPKKDMKITNLTFNSFTHITY